jgi:ABC-type lipoprotein release transport system permease subunit
VDPASFFGVSAILLMVALLAVLFPARRAISLDPVAALRND